MKVKKQREQRALEIKLEKIALEKKLEEEQKASQDKIQKQNSIYDKIIIEGKYLLPKRMREIVEDYQDNNFQNKDNNFQNKDNNFQNNYNPNENKNYLNENKDDLNKNKEFLIDKLKKFKREEESRIVLVPFWDFKNKNEILNEVKDYNEENNITKKIIENYLKFKVNKSKEEGKDLEIFFGSNYSLPNFSFDKEKSDFFTDLIIYEPNRNYEKQMEKYGSEMEIYNEKIKKYNEQLEKYKHIRNHPIPPRKPSKPRKGKVKSHISSNSNLQLFLVDNVLFELSKEKITYMLTSEKIEKDAQNKDDIMHDDGFITFQNSEYGISFSPTELKLKVDVNALYKNKKNIKKLAEILSTYSLFYGSIKELETEFQVYKEIEEIGEEIKLESVVNNYMNVFEKNIVKSYDLKKASLNELLRPIKKSVFETEKYKNRYKPLVDEINKGIKRKYTSKKNYNHFPKNKIIPQKKKSTIYE